AVHREDVRRRLQNKWVWAFSNQIERVVIHFYDFLVRVEDRFKVWRAL
ncbi:hypothetical protein D047_3842B, partial [Vibrio parahaemolyticus VPTS-2010_2]